MQILLNLFVTFLHGLILWLQEHHLLAACITLLIFFSTILKAAKCANLGVKTRKNDQTKNSNKIGSKEK
jgi:hypothetical protein